MKNKPNKWLANLALAIVITTTAASCASQEHTVVEANGAESAPSNGVKNAGIPDPDPPRTDLGVPFGDLPDDPVSTFFTNQIECDKGVQAQELLARHLPKFDPAAIILCFGEQGIDPRSFDPNITAPLSPSGDSGESGRWHILISHADTPTDSYKNFVENGGIVITAEWVILDKYLTPPPYTDLAAFKDAADAAAKDPAKAGERQPEVKTGQAFGYQPPYVRLDFPCEKLADSCKISVSRAPSSRAYMYVELGKDDISGVFDMNHWHTKDLVDLFAGAYSDEYDTKDPLKSARVVSRK